MGTVIFKKGKFKVTKDSHLNEALKKHPNNADNFHIKENLAIVVRSEQWDNLIQLVDYCEKENITPKDLIEVHKNLKKVN